MKKPGGGRMNGLPYVHSKASLFLSSITYGEKDGGMAREEREEAGYTVRWIDGSTLQAICFMGTLRQQMLLW